MTRVDFVVGPALGHFSRMHVAASRLRELADVDIRMLVPHTVRFPFDIFGEDLPITTIPAPESQWKMSLRGGRRLHSEYARGLERAFAANHPDVIVHDCNPLRWLPVVRWPDCPRISATEIFLTHVADLQTVQAQRFILASDQINREREAKNLQPLESVFDLYEADRVLLLDPNQVIDLFGPLPAHYRKCGPCSWSFDRPIPEELIGVSDALLCSMGSTGLEIPTDLVRVLKARTGCDTSIFVSVSVPKGGPVAVSGDAHDFRYPDLPLRKIYDLVKVVVSQGGAGSTYQALSFGKPIIAVPSHDNHRICAGLLARLGVGRLVEAEGNYSALDDYDYPAMAAAAMAFAAEMANVDGPGNVAEAIVEFC